MQSLDSLSSYLQYVVFNGHTYRGRLIAPALSPYISDFAAPHYLIRRDGSTDAKKLEVVSSETTSDLNIRLEDLFSV